MADGDRGDGLDSLIDISVEAETAPPLRIRIGTVEPIRLVELRAGGVSLFIHGIQSDAAEIREETILH